MKIEIDIDGLHCDGKKVMTWVDPSDLPARERLISEFDRQTLCDKESYLHEEISDLSEQIGDMQDIIDSLETKLHRLEKALEE